MDNTDNVATLTLKTSASELTKFLENDDIYKISIVSLNGAGAVELKSYIERSKPGKVIFDIVKATINKKEAENV